jgi:hypothetical protein
VGNVGGVLKRVFADGEASNGLSLILNAPMMAL